MIIDATDCRVGRMATHAAKAALEGQDVIIVNCEEAIITGTKKMILKKYITRRRIGRPTKGPFLPRMPDRFVRRIVRSMLPYKSPRGVAAFKHIQCYIGTPKGITGAVQIENKPASKAMKIKELCTLLGGRA